MDIMDFINKLSTIKPENDKEFEKTKSPHIAPVKRSCDYDVDDIENQSKLKKIFQPPTPFRANNIMSSLPTIKKGVSLNKTFDTPLRAVNHTPVHISNCQSQGYFLPRQTTPTTPNTISISNEDQTDEICLNKTVENVPINKPIPTIRLTAANVNSSLTKNNINVVPGIKIKTFKDPELVALSNKNKITIPKNSKVVQAQTLNPTSRESIFIKASNNTLMSKTVSPSKTSSNIDENSLNIFDFHNVISTDKNNILKEFENENLDVAEYKYNDAYSNYEPTKYKKGKPHPYIVVESRSLMSTDSPDITYELKLPKVIINKGILSNVQLEAVVYACQKHEEELFDGKRYGFLIGDGAGVGKGRTVGGIIFENFLSGRKKSIWISVSNDLKLDAERDLRDIGEPIGIKIPVATLNKMSYNKIELAENGSFNEGVLFVTYSSLISKCKNKDRNVFHKRLDQIIDWFGKEYDGVIVFDECHKAKNLQQRNKTKTGSSVKRLQEKLCLARVVYASATGASEPKHMAYMTRLGLWGPGKCFSGFDDFDNTLTSLGVGAMELIAIEMKKSGVYLARQLSFQNVKFDIAEIKIQNSSINGHNFKDVYNKCVEVWNEIYREFNLAFQRNKFEERDESHFEAQFWSAHQRFFKYLCIAGKIQECVRISKMEVEQNNNCVVIGLQTTGEARTMDLLDEVTGDHDHFVSSAKGVVETLIKNHYPSLKTMEKNKTRRQIKSLKSNSLNTEGSLSEISSIESIISNADPNCSENKHISLMDSDGERRMLKLVEKIDSMFPLNALDQLIHELGGPKYVAEMTGRKGRLIEENGVISYQLRKQEDVGLDQINILEKDQFNSGEKNFAIISDAASTGISLHSDKRFLNKKKRFHITLELPWSADKAIQQFGRTHRSNQIQAPHYIFLISDLAGERRFAATIAKRLESLGALTHGDRRCVDSRDLNQFNLDTEIGSKAVFNLINTVLNSEPQVVSYPTKYVELYNNSVSKFQNAAAKALISVGLDKFKTVTVTKFLNRILGMELDMQNAVFQYFMDIIDYESQKAKARNEYDHGIRDIMNDHDNLYVMESYTFSTESKFENDKIVVNKIKNINGISWEDAFNRYNDKRNESYFCVSKSTKNSSMKFFAYVEHKENDLFLIMKPNYPGKEIDKVSLEHSWEKVQPDFIRKDWEYIYRESKDKCLHKILNISCSQRECTVGQRTKINYLITEGVLSALKKLDSANISKKLEIIRVQLFDNSKLIGALVPQSYYKVVMKALETGYSIQSMKQISMNEDIEFEQNEPKEEEEKESEKKTPKKASKKSSDQRRKVTQIATDYSRINEIISSQLTKSKKPDSPIKPKPIDAKPKVKREYKKEEFSEAWKDLQYPNIIVNFISEDDH